MAALADLQELLGEFLAEAGELLDDVDRGLVELERSPRNAELLNRVFRGFHTIKGGAGFLEAGALVDLCHRTETLFDKLRSGKLALSAELMDAILAATGEVRRMFGEMAGGAMPSAAPASLLEALAAAATGAAPSDGSAAPAPARAAEPAGAPGNAPAPAASEAPRGAAPVPDWDALYAALAPARPAGAPAPVPGPGGAPGPGALSGAPAAKAAAETTIRVDTARYDQILNLAGEIGLTRNRLACVRTSLLQGGPQGEGLKSLDLVVNLMAMLVGDLQNAVMKARLQPVGRVFQKYNRLARDVARQLGKEVELQIEGEATEVDKTILDALNDPLVHLVRNAVDHGVETPGERAAAGKPPKALVRLSARQEGDRIVIEVADDGRGMRPEAIRAKALEKGLIGADAAATLDERASLALIFLPGFSTKEAISDLSGRGVGMDVVRTNILKLKGRVDIVSEPGRGSRVVIVLPLTLAIMPVLVLGVCGQRYALPLSAVHEVLNADPGALDAVAGVPALRVRGEALPFVDLAAPLGRERGAPPAVAVVAQVGEKLLALGADLCYGRDEVMLKPLEGFKPRGVAGATLAADGGLVVVLELAELLGLPA
jgi:two-component system chemotaxis sensor kinase CheA